MKKKMVSLVLVAVMTLTMGACGKKEDAPRYGLVTNTEGIGTESLNAEAWASIQEAAGSEYLYKYYTAEKDTDKGVDEQFDAAADDGTELVFAKQGMSWLTDFRERMRTMRQASVRTRRPSRLRHRTKAILPDTVLSATDTERSVS